MAQLPTPEESARTILQQFRTENIRAGEILMRGSVEINAQKNGLRASDVEAGLKHAVDRGWIDISDPRFVRLTEIGFGEL